MLHHAYLDTYLSYLNSTSPNGHRTGVEYTESSATITSHARIAEAEDGNVATKPQMRPGP